MQENLDLKTSRSSCVFSWSAIISKPIRLSLNLDTSSKLYKSEVNLIEELKLYCALQALYKNKTMNINFKFILLFQIIFYKKLHFATHALFLMILFSVTI
jgi:hypothetical protein